MIRFSNAQVSSVKEAYKNDWLHTVANEIWLHHFQHLRLLGITKDDLDLLCENLWEHFSPAGVTQRSHLLQLCLIALSIGGRFYEDPRYPTLIGLCQEEMPAARRIAYLRLEARRLIKLLWPVGDAAPRLREMVLAMDEKKAGKFSDLNFPSGTCDQFALGPACDLTVDQTNVLIPLIPVIGPFAMIDPVHAQFRRIVRNASSEAEARRATQAELQRRLRVLAS